MRHLFGIGLEQWALFRIAVIPNHRVNCRNKFRWNDKKLKTLSSCNIL